MAKVIEIHAMSNVKAEGVHGRKNHKPVYCITTGVVYASQLDAAEKLGVDNSAISAVVRGKTKTAKGMRFCYLSKIMDYMEEIATMARMQSEKATAYDKMIAEQNAYSEAAARVEKHTTNVSRLRERLEKEMKLLSAAEAKVAEIKARPTIWH